MKDITLFFRYDSAGRLQPLPSNPTDDEILHADAATLRISNQKNRHVGACIHHEAIADNVWACPIKALARRYTHTSDNTPKTPKHSSAHILMRQAWDL